MVSHAAVDDVPGSAQSHPILVVSTDRRLLQVLTGYFERKGLKAIGLSSVQEALAMVLGEVDIAVVDATNDSDSALLSKLGEFLRRPLVAITATDTNNNIAGLLRAGADSVIVKPFTLDALDAHVEALSRHDNGILNDSSPTCYSYKGLIVDFQAHSVTVADQRVHLSGIQFRLLELLCRHAGTILTPLQISEHVWGTGYDANSGLIKAHIRNLRARLKDCEKCQDVIKTRRSIGYWVPKDLASAR